MAYDFKRPDGAAMTRVLTRHPTDAPGVILRLAWLAGLSRGEIRDLTWPRVDFAAHALTLPDRTVPMDPELEACLLRRFQDHAADSDHVVITERDRRPMPPESVSRLARQALDAEGLAVSLKDLRQDFVIRALETHDWTWAARVSGMAVSTLRGDFAPYLQTAPARREDALSEMRESEYLLWRVVQSEGSSAVGLAVWMAWQLRMQPGEIAALDWSQVDFDENLLRLPDRSLSMGSRLRRLLLEAWDRQRELNPHAVFIAPTTGTAMDLSRLTTVVRTALIRGGLERVDLRTLSAWARREEESRALLELAARQGYLTVEDAMTALQTSKSAARSRVTRLRQEGRLTRVGVRYYPVEQVLPADGREDALRAYLMAHGSARRGELAELLHLPPKQAGRLLQELTARGVLVSEGRRYRLPPSEDVTLT